MNKIMITLIIASLLVGATLGYLPMQLGAQSLQNQLVGLKEELLARDNQIQTLQNEMSNQNEEALQKDAQIQALQNQVSSLNQSYVELSQQYEDLLFHYNLLNGPISSFTTLQDLQIKFYLHRTTYYYQDSLSGNVTIKYLNETAFQGRFSISLSTTTPTGAVTSGAGTYSINGFTEFVANPPVFTTGPGTYTISLAWIKTLDGYYIATGSVQGTEIQVEVK